MSPFTSYLLRKYLVPASTPWGIYCLPRDDIVLVHPYLNGPRKMTFACTCQFVPKIKLRPHPAMSHCKMLIPSFMIPKPHSSMSHSKPLISLLAIPSGSGWSLHPLISSNSRFTVLHIDLFVCTSFFKSLSLQFRVVQDGPCIHSSSSTFNNRMPLVVPVKPEHLKLAHLQFHC